MQRSSAWLPCPSALALVGLVLASGHAFAQESGGVSASAASSDASTGMTHFFGNTRHLQAAADQVGLSTQTGPLPFTLSGNVQSWTSGPPLADLYTEAAQATYRIDDTWKLLGQQLYQEQSSISLWNFVGGVGYSPTEDFSLNAMVGVGIHTQYTYQWAAYVSPQYTLPVEINGEKWVAFGANFTFEDYELGSFSQVTPRVSLKIASWLPQLQIGYAFGEFDETTEVTQTQYYQPQAVSGLNVTAVLHPFDSIYAVLTYLPENRNYIAGNYVTQNTIGAALHVNLSPSFRASAFYQDTWYAGGSDYAIGGGGSIAF
ncbi:hypothetical protein G3A50_21235 [Ancylobacter pratisalsi]|uniref:Transporter n=1 Tax=Ancylobacter pratisalsi TaxID=1745854 RepID=A0A6P1YT10_9HYPH|nr:hypothetical protein G3A50_21235 [Ancylobacter pratisalsi]